MTPWQERAASVTAAMLGVEPNAGVGFEGGWPQAWHEAVTAGLDAGVVRRIARVTGWTPDLVCEVAGLSARRSDGVGRLDPLESERVARLAWIAGIALVAVDGHHGGRDWFASWAQMEFPVLDGHAPIELMCTLPGALWLRDALEAWLRGVPL